MKIRELMTAQVKTCSSDSDLASVAMIMWSNDCGIVPVVDGRSSRVVGVITDRDICMAAATRLRSLSQIRVSDVVQGPPCTVGPDDDVETALERLAVARVRRLPVVGSDGEALGMLSLNDLILRARLARSRAKSAALADGVLRTLKAVSEHHPEVVTTNAHS